jgi:acetyl-CoA synthetase
MSEIVRKPTDDYIEKANIMRFMKKHYIQDYDELIKRSIEELEWFWDAVMEDLKIEWYQPHEEVFDDSKRIQ